MLMVVNYADEKFQPYQKLQTQTAYHFGADKVREYSPADLSAEFYNKNKAILNQPRGAGYWIWKPYIILDALYQVEEGDIVFYADSGTFFISNIQPLIDAMNRTQVNIMTFNFGNDFTEKIWTKRDAFILMNCDEPKYTDTPQLGATFCVFRKCAESIQFVEEWLNYIQDARISTDLPNQLGLPNYPEFIENRHDQTILSLLAKKHNLPAFRFPSDDNFVNDKYSAEIWKRSDYPKIFYHHRRNIHLEKTMEDFIRLYGEEPRLCEGVRSVKFLLTQDMFQAAYELLLRLYNEYRGSDDWRKCWDDLIKISEIHARNGAFYAELFQPLICKIFLIILRQPIDILQIQNLVKLAAHIENKYLIPQEFQDALISFIARYIEFDKTQGLPIWMKSSADMWNDYQKLNMPETPLKKALTAQILNSAQ